jgi:two-component sensor histidine kinase
MAFLCAGINLPAQNPYIQHFTTSDGLPSNSVYQVYQDSKKFIWFATNAGVARFDGSKFTYFRKQDGLSCNDIVKIKEDSKGRIWFFNVNAMLNFYYNGKLFNSTNTHFLDSLVSDDFFRNFFEDEDKTLYFYNNDHLDIYSLDSADNIKKYKLTSAPKKIRKGANILKVEGMMLRNLCRPDGVDFLLCTYSGLYKTSDLSGKLFLMDTVGYRAVFPAINENYYCLSNENPKSDNWVVKKRDKEFLDIPSFKAMGLSSILISSIFEDFIGNVWISTFDQGVSCYNGNGMIQHFNITESQAIIQDHENNIWISSLNDGVYKISPYVYQHLNYDINNFQNCGILAMHPHLSDGIWLTNGKSVYLLRDDEIFSSDFQKNESAFNQIYQVSDNALIVGEIESEQYALEGIIQDSRLKKIHFKEVSKSPRPLKWFTMNRKRDKLLSFAYYNLWISDPVRIFRDTTLYNTGERIFNIYFNSKDELVINAKHNYLYLNDSLELYKDLRCFDNRIISDHLLLDDSTELLNVEGDSLFILSERRLYNLTASTGYTIDQQIKYVNYKNSTLVIGTSSNIYLCENPLKILDGGQVTIFPIDITFKNIHDVEFNGDRLYIGSDDGLAIIPHSEMHDILSRSPLPYFQEININDKMEVSDLTAITLTGRNRIHIGFGSINYSAGPVIFSYKLEGLDHNWITGAGTNVVYQDLPKGQYLFKLRVRKPASEWGEPITLGINIKATIWQHPLFFITAAFLLIGFFVIIILRRKNAEMKQREMEHQLVVLEQKALQSMMNPHFIFNSLGSIQNYLLQSKAAEAGLYLSQFARLIRQNLNAIDSEMINLEEETDRLKNYLDLEKKRMENKFDYHLEIDKSVESEEIQIPSMIVQPFVENSIWHGIANLDGKGFIRILFRINDEKSMEIIVEDNGIGIPNAEKFTAKGEKHLKLGMQMTRKRLELLGKKYHVETKIDVSEISPGSPNPGTKAVLIVPFI